VRNLTWDRFILRILSALSHLNAMVVFLLAVLLLSTPQVVVSSAAFTTMMEESTAPASSDPQKLEDYLEYLENRKNDEAKALFQPPDHHRLHSWECTRVSHSRYNPGGRKGTTMPSSQFQYYFWRTYTWNCTVCHESWQVDLDKFPRGLVVLDGFPVEHYISAWGCPGPRDP
jgi:hypothetical protein